MRRFVLLLVGLALLGGCKSDAGDKSANDATTTTAAAITGEFGSSVTVPAKIAQAWIPKWCTVQPGQSRDELRKVMGTPTNDFGDQDQWEAFNLSFVAFYDSHFVAVTLQTDTERWTAEDKAALTCDDVRRI